MGEDANEFVQIVDFEGFKVYVVIGKAVRASCPEEPHQSPREVFLIVLEGEIKFSRLRTERDIKAGEFRLARALRLVEAFETSLSFQEDDDRY